MLIEKIHINIQINCYNVLNKGSSVMYIIKLATNFVFYRESKL